MVLVEVLGEWLLLRCWWADGGCGGMLVTVVRWKLRCWTGGGGGCRWMVLVKMVVYQLKRIIIHRFVSVSLLMMLGMMNRSAKLYP